MGRYLAYGAISALLLASRWRGLAAGLGRRAWLALVWLALLRNTLYYLLLSGAVQQAGIATTSLVIGFLPVAVTVIGSRAQDAVPLRRLWPSLLLCAGGAMCIGWQAMGSPASARGEAPLVGLACAIGALASWTAFAVGNARWLGRVAVSSHDWNLLLGVTTGAQSLLLLAFALAGAGGGHDGADWMRLAAVSLGGAVFASMLGNALWNRMSRLLPLTLVGQMILFETLSALIYGFAWEQRTPAPLELAAFLLVVASVVTCIAAHRRPAGKALAQP